jgi:hypothetical protein
MMGKGFFGNGIDLEDYSPYHDSSPSVSSRGADTFKSRSSILYNISSKSKGATKPFDNVNPQRKTGPSVLKRARETSQSLDLIVLKTNLSKIEEEVP